MNAYLFLLLLNPYSHLSTNERQLAVAGGTYPERGHQNVGSQVSSASPSKQQTCMIRGML